MKPTIKKIANDLNLAVSTVSKALSDSYEISSETKKRVIQYAQKLDYVPNFYASTLKHKKSGNIAIVLPEVADSFFSDAISGIESIAQTKGYHVMVYLTHEDLGKQISILKDLRGGRVDGALISVCEGSPNDVDHLKEVGVRNLPFVFFDRSCRGVEASRVITDDFESSYKATQLLISRGCKRVAFFATDNYLDIIDLRWRGYLAALRDNKLRYEKILTLRCSKHEKQVHRQILELLRSSKRPDGIVGSLERIATITYSVCQELKIKIPRDLKIVAYFSSLHIASLLKPSLSTIKQPAFEMGKTAATLLFNMLEDKQGTFPNQTIVLPSTLIERDSTGKRLV